MPGDLGIDLGKTSCRIRSVGAGAVGEAAFAGASGFASGAVGVEQALASVRGALGAVPAEVTRSIRRIGVSAAGVDANRAEAARFATSLSALYSVPVAVVSDALAAHAGALGGRPGTVLIAGTGAVAFHIDSDGELTRADGWGVWLGDLGSGRWIGQEGLKSVLRARDRVGPPTSLAQAAIDLAGSFGALPAYVSDGPQPERVLAAFAPTVLEHAESGDGVASSIVARAVDHLTATAAACTPPGGDLAVVGGLTASHEFHAALAAALSGRGLRVVPALADAVDGALLIAADPSLPHERFAIRVQD